jgi:hypothetical protein
MRRNRRYKRKKETENPIVEFLSYIFERLSGSDGMGR